MIRLSPFRLRLCEQRLEELVNLDMAEQDVFLPRVHQFLILCFVADLQTMN